MSFPRPLFQLNSDQYFANLLSSTTLALMFVCLFVLDCFLENFKDVVPLHKYFIQSVSLNDSDIFCCYHHELHLIEPTVNSEL